MEDINVSYGKPYPLGATCVGPMQVNFAVVMNTDKPCGVILYDRKLKTETKLSFGSSNRVGNIRCMMVSNIEPKRYDYNYYIEDEIIHDPYAKCILGNETWGKKPQNLRAGIYLDDYNWENDKNPFIPYNESVMYLLHVRGFTKHRSSGVTHPGTFCAVTEKIPYLKELGVNTLELMPVYNFVELEEVTTEDTQSISDPFESIEPKLNYWGYKNSFYFAPKASYAPKGQKADVCFKNMINELHANGIEVVLQFFFPDKVKQGYIFEVLKFWMQEYHVDGFHLMGNKLPLTLLGTEPMLANTKIICDHFPFEEIYENGIKPGYKNLAISRDEYMYDTRRILKSDEGMVPKTLDYMKNMPEKYGEIHYITHGNTFTLMDLVSYDRKHNEDNGENNRDGAPYNGSWNCGFEGPTNRVSVKKLRMRQIKNAIILNMFAKTTPLIVAGDEFGNSQNGNNNPYCHDNSTTWLNWGQLSKNNEIFDFMKKMIFIRKEYGVLHMPESFKMNDYLQCGFPDLSFHSAELWKVDTDILSRQFAMLYCGKYGGDDLFIYVAINLHWTAHEFAIPKLPRGYKWEEIISTDSSDKTDKNVLINPFIEVKERSITIMLGKK